MARRRAHDDDAPPALARDVVRLAVEHVVPAIVHQVGEALRERAERRHRPPTPPPPKP